MTSKYVPPLSQSYIQGVPQVYSSYAPQTALSAANYAPTQIANQPAQNTVAPAHLRGNSRIEYVPYQRKVIDYEQKIYTQTVPKERYVTDYYAIEHTTNYIPQTYYESYVDYVPVQRFQERVQYYPVQNSRVVINKLQ